MLRASGRAGLALPDVPGRLCGRVQRHRVFSRVSAPSSTIEGAWLTTGWHNCARVHSLPPACISTVPRASMQKERCSSLANVLGDALAYHPRGSVWGLFWPGVTVGGAKRWNKPAWCQLRGHTPGSCILRIGRCVSVGLLADPSLDVGVPETASVATPGLRVGGPVVVVSQLQAIGATCVAGRVLCVVLRQVLSRFQGQPLACQLTALVPAQQETGSRRAPVAFGTQPAERTPGTSSDRPFLPIGRRHPGYRC